MFFSFSFSSHFCKLPVLLGAGAAAEPQRSHCFLITVLCELLTDRTEQNNRTGRTAFSYLSCRPAFRCWGLDHKTDTASAKVILKDRTHWAQV